MQDPLAGMVSGDAMFRYGLAWLWRRAPFSDLERQILSNVARRLSGPWRSLFLAQLERTNLVQRHSNGREVRCYTIAKGRAIRDPAIRMPLGLPGKSVTRLANIEFTNAGQRCRAHILLVGGYLSAIEFDVAPRRTTRGEGVLINKVEFDGSVVEPAPSDSVTATFQPSNIPRQVLEWGRGLSLSEVRVPLPPPLQVEALRRIRSIAPADYLALMQHCDGLLVGDVIILSPSEIYEVILSEANYYILGLFRGGVLAIRMGADQGVVQVFRYEEEDKESRGACPSLRAAVDEALATS